MQDHRDFPKPTSPGFVSGMVISLGWGGAFPKVAHRKGVLVTRPRKVPTIMASSAKRIDADSLDFGTLVMGSGQPFGGEFNPILVTAKLACPKRDQIARRCGSRPAYPIVEATFHHATPPATQASTTAINTPAISSASQTVWRFSRAYSRDDIGSRGP
jgi:hypothetical protein